MIVLAGFLLSIPGWLRNYDGFAGQLLIASPQLEDPNFQRTVVLVTAHNPLMARGYVLNRFLSDPDYGDNRRWGGPLKFNEQRILTRNSPVNSSPIANTGLSIAEPDSDYERSETDLFFTGYASWGIGQLEKEIEAGDWQIRTFTPAILDMPYQTMWNSLSVEEKP